MTTPPNNPFILPGFGQTGDMAQNPVLASMEMMRHAWQNLAGSGSIEQSFLAAATSPEELDKRITDLRTVENWLRLNLSMLSSTIQGMEVQRATLSTLRSFVASTTAAPTADAGHVSPLDAVLGIRPQTAQAAAQPAAPEPGAEKSPSAEQTDASLAGAAAAAQGWWDMLQKQFDTLATATTASMQGAEALKAAAATEPTTASAPKTKSRTPRKTAAKSTPRTAAARKTSRRS